VDLQLGFLSADVISPCSYGFSSRILQLWFFPGAVFFVREFAAVVLIFCLQL
jgi:hypothetical protein